MILANNSLRSVNTAKSDGSDGSALERFRSIAYSMDTLIPGFYAWFGSFALQVGGCKPDDEPYRYPGVIHSRFGIAIVLPGYRIFTTYSGSYDPRQAQN